jgi:hypothetical protein
LAALCWGSEPGDRRRTHATSPAAATRWWCLVVELRETEIDVLVQKGLLNADARNDARCVREALYQYFDSTLN